MAKKNKPPTDTPTQPPTPPVDETQAAAAADVTAPDAAAPLEETTPPITGDNADLGTQIEPGLVVTETAPAPEPTHVTLQLPRPPADLPDGHTPTSFDISLNGRQANTLRRLGHAYKASGSGVSDPSRTLGWLLDLLGSNY